MACVFINSGEDGLGEHYSEGGNGQCMCHTIYGERDYRTLGYLKTLPRECTDVELQLEREKAQCTGTVVIREGATEEARNLAEKEAEFAWFSNKKRASWGCKWFEKWQEQVARAVLFKQRLKVVFFPAELGQGILPWEDLCNENVNLWNGIGCGGSQKCEIAFLERKKQEAGDAWAYDCVDVAHFLKDEFKVGAKVDAFDGQKWWKSILLSVPKTVPKDPKDAYAKWVVQSHHGDIFATDRVRHADLMNQMIARVGQHEFMDLVKGALPGLRVEEPQEFIFKDGTPALAIRLKIGSIHLLQDLRNKVLSGNLEALVNKGLERSTKWQVHLDKTYFCEVYEKELLSFSELTQHQKDKLKDTETLLNNGPVHISAPAGTGKTFIAVECAYKKVRTNDGMILFVSPSIGLGLYFLQWLLQKGGEDLKFQEFQDLLSRIILMEKPYETFLKLSKTEHGRLKRETCESSGIKMEFILAIVDEAHDVFQAIGYNGFFNNKIEAKQRLLLSSKSQASGIGPFFPGADLVELTEVVRSTKRIVAGSAAFQGSEGEKIGVSALCPEAGPPLKSFLFDSDRDDVDYDKYAEKTITALWELTGMYRGLSFHRRVALLVPDDGFLTKFKKTVQSHLNLRFPRRVFELESFEDSLAILPNQEQKETAEVMVLDTVEKAKGLEKLFVFCVALDKKLGSQKINCETRASIYQALTRAQLQVVVVNQRLQGGWFEFLGRVKFKNDVFDEASAMDETTTQAASRSISKSVPSEPVGSEPSPGRHPVPAPASPARAAPAAEREGHDPPIPEPSVDETVDQQDSGLR